jgi:glycosyltransferase involved in cell wall biosynthesis
MSGIAIVTERALPAKGGLAKAASRVAQLSAREGEAVHLITLSRDATPGGRGREQRGDVIVHPVGLLDRQDESLMALHAHALDIVREHEIDVVHGMYGTSGGYVAALVGAERDVASVVSLRGNDLDRGLFRAQDASMLRLAVDRATVVTGVSSALARRAAHVFDREVAHVTNSVDSVAFKPEAKDNSLVAAMGLGESQVIGFSGELREKKGMRFLLPAFASLCERRDVRLLLLGGVRADADDAMAAFEKAAPDAAARIHVTEHTTDPRRLSRLYALADVFVFPSLMEGTPNAVLEVMACGRPVLATNVGGHPDLVEHGVNGALLSLDMLDRLPEAIDEMLELAPSEREAMGKAARAQVVEQHLPEAEARVWAKIYARARQGRR